VAAVDVGRELATPDLIPLPAVGHARCQRQRRGQAYLDLPRGVEPRDHLGTRQATREEGGLVGDAGSARGAGLRGIEAGAERLVKRVPQVVREVVVAERDAEIEGPAARQ